MNIEEWRKQPEMAGMDDQSIVQIVREAFYPDRSPEEVAQSMGVNLTTATPAAPEEGRGVLGWARDAALSVGKGIIAVPEAAVGLADLATGGEAGRFLENKDGMVGFRPKEAKEALSELHTDQQKAANKNVMEAEGLWETVKAAVRNPSVAGMSVLESLPGMLGGGLVGRGVVAAGRGMIGGGLAAGLGEGVVAAGGAAEAIRQETEDGRLTGEQARLAGATGLATTAFGALGAKIAKRLGIGDIDEMIVGAATNPKAAKSITRMVLEGAVSEGLLEELPQSVSEQVLQNMALGKPLDEGVNQAAVLGTMAGGLMGGGANVYKGVKEDRPLWGKGTTPPPAPGTPPAPSPAPSAPPAPAAAAPTPADVLNAPNTNAAIATALQAVGADPAALAAAGVPAPTPAGTVISDAEHAANMAGIRELSQTLSTGDPDPFSTPLQGANNANLPGGAGSAAPVAPTGMAGLPGLVPPNGAVPTAAAAPAGVLPGDTAGNAGAAAGSSADSAGMAGHAVPGAGGNGLDGGRRDADVAGGLGAVPAGASSGQQPGAGNAGGAQGPSAVTPESLSLRIARAKAAVGEAEGRLKNKPNDANRLALADAKDVLNAAQTAAGDHRAGNADAWSGYEQSQQQVAQLREGDRVALPDGREATIMRKFKARWHLDPGDGSKIMEYPAALRALSAPGSATGPGALQQLKDKAQGKTPAPQEPTNAASPAPAQAAAVPAPAPAEKPADAAADGATAPAGVDAAGQPAAGVGPREDEPPLAAGMTRLYHGSATPGRYDGPAWFSTSRQYAQDYRTGAELQYVDYPTAKVNAAADPDNYGQTPAKGFTWNVELDASETGPRKPLLATKEQASEQDQPRGQAPAPEAASGEAPPAAGGNDAAGAPAAADAGARAGDVEGAGVDDTPLAQPVQFLDGIEAGKAAPLYAQRKVKNAADIIAWAKEQGFTDVEDAGKLHVTIAFSRQPVDPGKLGNISPAYEKGRVSGGERAVQKLGEDGAIVLMFKSPVLQSRWNQFQKAGASWDFEGYQPHITISYGDKALDLSKVKPYTGPIELGPELVEPLDLSPGDASTSAVESTTSESKPDQETEAVEPESKPDRAAQDKVLSALHFLVNNRAGKDGRYTAPDPLRFNELVREAKAAGIKVSSQVGASGTVVWTFEKSDGWSYSAYLATNGKGTWLAHSPGTEAAQENLQQRLDDARRLGREAGERGDPRDPPMAFTNGEKQVWRAGWDQSKATKVTPQIPPAPPAPKPDKAEIRPFRRPDGSIGYEAIPISAPAAEAAAPVADQKPPAVSDKPDSGQPASDKLRAKADLQNALADLADLFGKNTKLHIVPPELEPKLLPVLTRVLDAAFRLGYHSFKDAAKFALDTIRAQISPDVADALTLDHLQGAYISMAGGKPGATSKREVVNVESKEEIEAHTARAAQDEAPSDSQDGADGAQDEEQTQPEPLFGANDHDTAGNDTGDDRLLDGQLPQAGAGDGQGGNAQAGEGVRDADQEGNGSIEEDRPGRGDGLDGSQEPVLSGTPADAEHPAEIQPLADGPLSPEHGGKPPKLAGENPGNFAIPDDFGLGDGTDGQKIEANLEALRTLRRVQAEHRYPTREEQATMARYVGWGGLKNVFDVARENDTGMYGRAQRELRTLLSASEFNDAAASIRNAHYTAAGVVDAMWRVARFMGFNGGRALEPTVGVGNFLGRQPADLAAGTEWHASELDAVTGQLAAMLYPEANVLAATGFQDAPFADDAFDLAIGNPPFGSAPIHDKTARRKHLSGMKVHNYIIAKTGMHLRPGGVMAMVVTHRFLDTANPEARDVLAKDFKFLGAFRLPNDAFAKNAGTEVVTDVVFLQKLRADEKRERDASWLDVNGEIEVDGAKIRVNRYYQDNPSHLLGRSAMDGTLYAGAAREGGEYTLHSDGRDLGQAIDALMTDGGLKPLQGVLTRTAADMDRAPAMLAQSDLPVGGVLLGDDGRIIRRELDDAAGNAVLAEITPETLWKDKAAEWEALRDAIVNVKQQSQAGLLTAEDTADVLHQAGFLFKADGSKDSDPTKAQAAAYELVDALATPGIFRWNHDAGLELIEKALANKRLGEKGHATLKAMLDLRNRTLALVRAEQSDDKRMDMLRAQLNAAYDAFVKTHGFLSDPKNANLLDGDIGAEAGLEASFTPAVNKKESEESGQPVRKASAVKADILSKRVGFPYKEIDHADNASDALFASLTEHGRVDLPYMARITGKSVVAVINELTAGEHPQLFMDPEGGADGQGEYQEAERYLSGNVRHKLAVARERGMAENVKALEAVQPPPKTKEQVRPNIRGMWMPKEIFEEFLQAIGYRNVSVSILPAGGMMSAQATGLSMTEFGVQFRDPDRDPLAMFNAAVAGKPITVTRKVGDSTVKDDVATKRVNALVERMAKVFGGDPARKGDGGWAYSDADRAQRILDAFNEKMNTHAERSWDGEKYLRTVGANPSVKLRRTQKNAAWRMIQSAAILLDHVVGAGKTYTIITGVMERRRMGLSRKPMIAVPNHLVTQWARDFYKLYPGARVLAATPADFAKKNRRRLLARIATGDYDAVIIGHSSMGFIQNPPADEEAVINEKLEELRAVLAEARRNKDSKRTLGQIEDKIARYEDKLAVLRDRPTDDIGMDFKALGVDYLAVDEAHEFKNLEYSTSGERVVGMNDPHGSKKAFDLYLKVRGLRARGGAVGFATGTPVSNSLVEIYTVMSYLAHDELKLRQQQHFDAWSGAYAATETRLEYTSTQKLKPRRVLAGLNNLSALRQVYEQFADIITMGDLKRIYSEEKTEENERRKAEGKDPVRVEFPVPKVRGGKRRLLAGEITPAQREYMDYLVARMVAIEANKSDREYAKIDNPLNVMTDARKMSLDIRIVDPTLPRDPEGKVARSAQKIKDTYDRWDADRGTQMVFCDLSTPAKAAVKDAGKMVNATIEKLYSGAEAKRMKAQFKAMTGEDKFQRQWKLLAERRAELEDDERTTEEKRDALSEYFDGLEDPEATMLTADIGFSVYDDLRALLVEKGIPETEIAFIHDYNTPEDKAKLFERMNAGYVRVLLGSSQKMGAGTNAQQRLVALHHMDAPWRPSDVEQREGRIIRQGNMFYERDPDGFEVEIEAYSTNGTSDTVMWQILQRKAAAIEQFREGGLDTVEEEGGDSDQYAEFMAASTGNPVFRLKLEAERRLTELEAETSGALITRGNAQSFLGGYERRRNEAQRGKDAAEAADVSTAAYGGESGTAAEFAQAMEAAQTAYQTAYAEWTVKAEEAKKAVAEWEATPEATRPKKKPAVPIQPPRPTLATESVQQASGFARAMLLALKEAKKDRSLRIQLGAGVLTLEGQVVPGGNLNWELRAEVNGVRMFVAQSNAQSAAASDRMLQALTPTYLSELFRQVAASEAGMLESLEQRKKQADRDAAREVDTRARDEAELEVEWFKAQVAFAETQADLERGSRTNRFIEQDAKRPLSQGTTATLQPVKELQIGSQMVRTTGLEAGRYLEAVDAVGNPVVVEARPRIVDGKTQIEYDLMVEPASVRRPRLERERAEAARRDTHGAMGLGNEADVLFDQEPVANTPQTMKLVPQMQALADAVSADWENKPPIIVVGGVESGRVPVTIRIEAQRRMARGGGRPHAVIYAPRGKPPVVYLFALNLRTPERMLTSLYHEVLGHYGLRGHFGKEFDRHLELVAKLRRADVQAIIDSRGMDPSLPNVQLHAAEEVLAYMAQENPKLGLVQRAIALIKGFLREHLPALFADMALTDAEIIARFILPARRFVQGNGPRGGGLPTGFADTVALSQDAGLAELLQQFGQMAESSMDAERALNAGDRVFVAHDMMDDGGAELPTEVTSIEQLRAYTADQIIILPAGVEGSVDAEILFAQDDGLNSPVNYLHIAREGMREMMQGTPGKLHWWHKSLGTQYNLAERSPLFKRVYDRVQDFLHDVSLYATEAANLAPTILPQLQTWRDLIPWTQLGGSGKRAMSAADNKAIRAPILQGTLEYTRDQYGNPVHIDTVREQAATMTAEEKAQQMVANRQLPASVLRMWRGLPFEQFEAMVNTRFEEHAMRPGIVWTDTELRDRFGLTGERKPDGTYTGQIALYREFRAATDESITRLTLAGIVRLVGKDADWIRDSVMTAASVAEGKDLMLQQLDQLIAEQPDRATTLGKLKDQVEEAARKAQLLMDEGYAPLMRFGHYTVTAEGEPDENGKPTLKYFELFENPVAARLAAQRVEAAFAEEGEPVTIKRGTMNEEEYKLFAGMNPETAELFGEILGLDAMGDRDSDIAYQEFLRKAKANRSAMKRMIHRKGIAGFSDDMGRVLAAFVYSNARLTSRNLHGGEILQSVQAIRDPAKGGDREAGELARQATRLMEYVNNPGEEAHALRSLLFAQYLGGSIAAALVNMTQPIAVTTPYLSQFGGIKAATRRMGWAMKNAWKAKTGDAALDAAMKKAVEEGIVAPQEIHQLMAQSQGIGGLRSGDGTKIGNTLALGANFGNRLMEAWGKPFSTAELFNRRVTFAAAYRTAQEQGIANPYEFATKAVHETQFVYNKGSRPQWARGALGATLLTFKTYSISYLELVSRMWNVGEPGSPERAAGRRAVFFALAMVMLMGGAGGLPFVEDAEDIIDGVMQRLGYNWHSEQKLRELLEGTFGKAFGGFLEKGITGFPGAPIDVSLRLGMGNLIPGTGIFQKKEDHTRDVLEIAGPTADLGKRIAAGLDKASQGDPLDGAMEAAPKALRDVAKAVEMFTTGQYKDAGQRKVLDVDAVDAGFKAIGFQPGAVAKVAESDQAAQAMIGVAKLRESEIVGKWARGIAEKKPELVAEARAELLRWNERNESTPIKINLRQVMLRARNMMLPRSARIEKSAPKEVRAEARRIMAVENDEE